MNQREHYQERVISLKGILRLLASYWICVLLIAVVGGALGGTVGVIRQYKKVQALKDAPQTTEKKVKVNEAEFYRVKSVADTEDIVNEKQEYLENSILMRIDPMHKLTAGLRYSFVFADDEVQGNAALASIYNDELHKPQSMEQIRDLAGVSDDVSYLNEVITVDLSSVPGTIGITVFHYDREQADRLLDAIEQFFAGRKTLGEEIGGEYEAVAERKEPTETVDAGLLDTQTAKKADLINQQTALATRFEQLAESEIKYLELYRDARNEEGYEGGQTLTKAEEVKKTNTGYAKTFVKSGAEGFVLALAVCFAVALLLYIFSPVLLDESSLTDMYGVPVFVRVKRQNEAEEKCGLMAKLLAGKKPEGKLALIASKEEFARDQTLQCLLKELGEAKVPVVMAYSIDRKQQELEKLADVTTAFVIEKVGKSKHKKIDKQLLILSELGILVDGAFLI